MDLKQLLHGIEVSKKLVQNIDIKNITFHSQDVNKGDLFIAITGYNVDGHQYIPEAIDRGASVIVGEQDLSRLTVPYIRVQDAREALGKIAAVFYGSPCFAHKMIGITGTNGKTTTAHMIRHVLEFAEQTCSLIGTLGSLINGKTYNTISTTPDAITLQRLLKTSKDQCVVMEVSSHGIQQKRIEGVEYDYALFTNLSHEHLDYHANLEEYFTVKSKLFEKLKEKGEAIVNSHCPWGKRLIEKLRQSHIPVYTYGYEDDDDLKIVSVKGKVSQLITINEKGVIYKIELPMAGTHNVSNAMATILLARRMGLDFQHIKYAFASFKGTPGRLEIHSHPSGIDFVVDYAHTPDGLEKCLQTIQGMGYERIFHVFGFRGNRDTTKRGKMVDISDQYSERVFLTIDDLNEVSQEDMISELNVLSSTIIHGKATVYSDRTEAILRAWEDSLPGDCIVITGKGPEAYQQTFFLPTVTDRETIQYIHGQSITYKGHPFAQENLLNANEINP